MPIYEYICSVCDYKFEKFLKSFNNKFDKCPKCDNVNLQKLVSNTSFRLKGGGWYETDFKKNTDKKYNLSSYVDRNKIK